MPNLTSLLHFHACERENGMKMEEEEVESSSVRVGALELFWALYRTAWGQDLWDSSAISKIAREERDSGRMMGVKTCGHLLWKVRVGVTYKKGL